MFCVGDNYDVKVGRALLQLVGCLPYTFDLGLISGSMFTVRCASPLKKQRGGNVKLLFVVIILAVIKLLLCITFVSVLLLTCSV